MTTRNQLSSINPKVGTVFTWTRGNVVERHLVTEIAATPYPSGNTGVATKRFIKSKDRYAVEGTFAWTLEGKTCGRFEEVQ